MMRLPIPSLLLVWSLVALAPTGVVRAQHGEEAAPSDAHAGGHGEALTLNSLLHSEHVGELYGSVFNFLILFGIFFWVIKTKVNPQLAAKRQAMQEAMAEAARLKAEAEAKQREFQSRLDRLDDELGAIRADMVKAGEAERDRIVAEAEKKAARIRKDADFVIAQRFKQLRDDLTKEAVESAIVAADAVLREKAGAADQTRLADVYLTRLNDVAAEQKQQNQEKQA
jgi:F-type H+-transporting ATPase subunit b